MISVDTKKKELVGDFKNAGREWRPEGMPERVRVHDFLIPEEGKAIPYGVYDLTRNTGWVSVGIDHDTASFAVRTIGRWWRKMGHPTYPKARSLLITADSGGSNGARSRLWKWELQRFADRTGLTICVCHFPPGTSKWNKIEHRLFSFITQNWRGRPLVSLAVIVNLIGATTTSTGLKVYARLDEHEYPKIEVSDAQLAAVNLTPNEFHPEWNYSIKPYTQLSDAPLVRARCRGGRGAHGAEDRGDQRRPRVGLAHPPGPQLAAGGVDERHEHRQVPGDAGLRARKLPSACPRSISG